MSKKLFTAAKDSGEEQLLLRWNQWTPGLDIDDMIMSEVIGTLPAAPPEAIPEEIKILENPKSNWAFPGAISLERHDCLHVLLGRGLLPEDEAFVIGFTMGAAKDIQDWQYSMFRTLAVHWYPKPYNFKEEDLYAFDLGFEKGQRSKASDLHLFPFELFYDNTVGELRDRVGINKHQLRAAFRLEQAYRPDSPAARRLDIDEGNIDNSALVKFADAPAAPKRTKVEPAAPFNAKEFLDDPDLRNPDATVAPMRDADGCLITG